MSSGISNELENQIMQFLKLYGMESEMKINRKITKTGSVGRREPEDLFGVALNRQRLSDF